MNLYDISIENAKGETVPLSNYSEKVLLIVNTASKCGFTPQYQELQQLYSQFHAKGLEILAFPCNQFGAQEPDSNEQIQSFCALNYGVSFPVMAKVDVRGASAHPLFKYLTKHSSGLITKGIKWNFTKFLIDRKGKIVKRYAPQIAPHKIEPQLVPLLKES